MADDLERLQRMMALAAAPAELDALAAAPAQDDDSISDIDENVLEPLAADFGRDMDVDVFPPADAVEDPMEIIDVNDFLPAAAAGDEEPFADGDANMDAQEDEVDDEFNLREAARANFQAWRDTYFVPDTDARLEFVPFVGEEQFMVEEPQYMQHVYRPKNGDYQNLQLFAESRTVSFDWDFDMDIFMFLRLPKGGLALFEFCEPRMFPSFRHEILLNGALMDDSCLSLVTFGSHSDVLTRIFLPRLRMQQNDCRDDCDTVFDFILRRPMVANDAKLLVRASQMAGQEQGREYLFASNILSSLERVHDRAIDLSLSHMRLTEDMWRRLSMIEFQSSHASHMLVPPSFWRQTRAKEFGQMGGRYVSHAVGREYRPSEQELEFALSGLQSRATPIESVRFRCHADLRTVSDAEKWALALRRVRRFEVDRVQTTMQAWRSFWLSTAKNVSLVSINIHELVIADYGNSGFMELPLPVSVIRDCLQRNFFLERVVLRNAADWHDTMRVHIEPLLEMNRKHEHRLVPGETRLSVIRDRVLQTHSHPKKLFKILRDYPKAALPRSMSEPRSDLEPWTADRIEIRHLRVENGHLRFENGHLLSKTAQLSSEHDRLSSENSHVWSENARLLAEIAELRLQLNGQQAQFD